MQKHFLKMCGTVEEKMENARIAKQKLRQHLYLRFKTVIGDKICKFFGFSGKEIKHNLASASLNTAIKLINS